MTSIESEAASEGGLFFQTKLAMAANGTYRTSKGHAECPLSGVNRTSSIKVVTSATWSIQLGERIRHKA
jgi:hypothetical protein